MRRTFKLDGLECANCAAKMQNGIQGLEGVNKATVNFVTTKLIIEADDAKMDNVVEAARGIIKKLEPDVVMQKASY